LRNHPLSGIIHFIINVLLGLWIGYINFDVIPVNDGQEKAATAINEPSKPEETGRKKKSQLIPLLLTLARRI
jgi:hypothetical protein